MEDDPEKRNSWRTKLTAQATKAVKSVATRQQVRLAVKIMRAAPKTVAPTQAASISKAELTPAVTDRQVIPSEKPSATFRATQAARAAKALQATLARETVECERCAATVAANTARCRCGYPLQKEPKYEVAMLTLGTNARAANDEDFKRPADNLGDSVTAIYAPADTPKAD